VSVVVAGGGPDEVAAPAGLRGVDHEAGHVRLLRANRQPPGPQRALDPAGSAHVKEAIARKKSMFALTLSCIVPSWEAANHLWLMGKLFNIQA